MKILRLYHKKRAVSPVIAAILLIGLAVAAGAALFFVIIPMISTSTKIEFQGTPVFTNGTAKIEIKSTGTKSATITDIKLEANNGTWVEAQFDFTEISIEAGQGDILKYTFDEEIAGTITKWRVTVSFRPTDDAKATPSTLTREFNP
ncbi:MAG: archaellin/type IV pilin N-terminal domain-containing protein [Promethearchaeota archaeon]